MLPNTTIVAFIKAPLEQFEVFKIGFFINNSTLFVLISFFTLVYLFAYSKQTYLVVPNR